MGNHYCADEMGQPGGLMHDSAVASLWRSVGTVDHASGASSCVTKEKGLDERDDGVGGDPLGEDVGEAPLDSVYRLGGESAVKLARVVGGTFSLLSLRRLLSGRSSRG